jgi:hypothetical protein
MGSGLGERRTFDEGIQLGKGSGQLASELSSGKTCCLAKGRGLIGLNLVTLELIEICCSLHLTRLMTAFLNHLVKLKGFGLRNRAEGFGRDGTRILMLGLHLLGILLGILHWNHLSRAFYVLSIFRRF